MTYLHFYVTIYSTKFVRDIMKKLFASKKSLSAITILGGGVLLYSNAYPFFLRKLS